MGSYIAYGGSLDDPSKIEDLLAEAREFCRRNGWGWADWSQHFSGVLLLTQDEVEGKAAPETEARNRWPDPRSGVSPGGRAAVLGDRPPVLVEETHRGLELMPPAVDSFWLPFDPGGRLVNWVEYPAEVVTCAVPGAAHYLAHSLSVGTTGAPGTHARVCEFLDLLRRCYMRNLEVIDTTEYWKHRNYPALLAAQPIRRAASRAYGVSARHAS